VNWTLEVVTVPVADVDRAIAFYRDRLGFALDHDTPQGSVRFAQLTPPGSGCSIVVGTGHTDAAPGSVRGLQLVVPDIRAGHAQLVERGVEVGGIQVASREGGMRPARDDEVGPALDNAGMFFFADPDGNTWAVQQISARAGAGPA
jgi:catechol 2,3-dioxygenase-like lactoylglutathione lyase family enzyme